MATSKDRTVLSHLRTLFNVGAIRELSDGRLLERFATQPGESAELAFAVLVERHGPMVLRVCRSLLPGLHDAQDAFQATFLVLVKKARALWVRDSLGPWLHQVACRTALCARKAAARRQRHERAAAELTRECQVQPLGALEWAIHEEIDRLPESIRVPVILCDLEGRTHDQAARHLGWPVGTLKSRLTRGRDRLRERLRRRGLGPNAGLLAAIARPGVEHAIPADLIHATTAAAAHLATSQTFLQGSTAILAQGVLKSMFITRSLKAAALVFVVGAMAFGIDSAGQGQVQDPAPAAKAAQAKPGATGGSVIERGVLETTNSQAVFCKVEGRTSIVMIVPEGTYVKKGDAVCELDSATLRDQYVDQSIAYEKSLAAYENAKLSREVAEIVRAEFEKGTYKQDQESVQGEIALHESAVRKAEARLERTRQARRRLAEVADSREKASTAAEVISALELDDRLDDAELALAREKLALETAQRKKTNLETFQYPRRLKELLVELQKARTDEVSREQALQLEKRKVAKLKDQIENCKLLAPGDGVVLYANDRGDAEGFGGPQIQEGAMVRERQKIFSVPDLKAPMRVVVNVPAAAIAAIRPGARVRVMVDAFADRTLPGVVEQIAALRSFANRGAEVYVTRIRLEERLPGLRPGMTAEAEIDVSQPGEGPSKPARPREETPREPDRR